MSTSLNSKLRDPGRSPDLKIFVKDVADVLGKKRSITVKSWSTIKDVKDVLQQHLHVPQSAQRLYFGPLMTSGRELPNYRTLHDAGIYRSGETLLLVIKVASSVDAVTSSITCLKSKSSSDVCVSSSLLDLTSSSLKRTVQKARRGFALGLKPELVLDGSGGTYFLHDARKVKVAVFKPADEEPYAENNPRGYIQPAGTCADNLGEGMVMRAGIKPGEACLREVAAFLLDHGGFSGVPMTTLVEARHPAFNCSGSRLKLSEGGAAVGYHSISTTTASHSHQLSKKVGSFQDYVYAECTMDDISPSKLSIDEVHKVAILDIRLMNADRNVANLLCRRRPKEPDKFELVPIDHGFCLRSVCDVCWFDWCWLEWPQMKEPLTKRSKEYILGLDIESDALLLKERLRIPTEALDYFRASSKLLQSGVKAGLNLYEIAVMCCRNDNAGEVTSKLESLNLMASELATSAIQNGRWHHAAASRALEDLLSPESSRRLVSNPNGSPKSSYSHMFRSASNANFLSFSDDSQIIPTPMTQSSESDSSSDPGDIEEEECEEWAAGVIAGVKSDTDATIDTFPRQRAISVCSTDHSVQSDEDFSRSRSSPVGFWYTAPGSSQQRDNDDVSWSPYTSPHPSPRPSVSDRLKCLKPEVEAKVRFNVLSVVLSPPSLAVTIADRKDQSSENLEVTESLVKNSTSEFTRFGRSQSYSAFSFRSILDNPFFLQTNTRAGPSTSIDDSQFRVYFLKFVDLLIARETTLKKSSCH